MYKYEEIVHYFTLAIQQLRLKPGEKMPSLRGVANQFECSMSVCIQAFETLEYNGLVFPVEKTGFFVASSGEGSVPNPQNDDFSFRFTQTRVNSLTPRILETSIRSDVVQLGGTIPHPSLLPLKKLQQLTTKVLRKHENSWHQYTAAEGDPGLRTEIARLMQNKGVSVSVDEIIVTNGCMEALCLAIQSAVGSGGVIAIESPIFFGIIVLLEVLNVRVIEIPTTPNEGLDIDALSRVLAHQKIDACLVSANFQNPLGSVMSTQNKLRLLNLAAQHEFAVVEDDIYGDCGFDMRPTIPIKKHDLSDSVLYCASFSKTICPSFRLGWLIAGKQRDNCRNTKLAQTLGGPFLTQAVMAEFLKSGAYASHMRKFRKQIAQQTFQLREWVARHFPSGTKVTVPKGGYFLWIEYNGKMNAVELFEKAAAHKISITPGPVFSLENRFENAIRLTSGFPMDERVEAAVAQLGRWVA